VLAGSSERPHCPSRRDVALALRVEPRLDLTRLRATWRMWIEVNFRVDRKHLAQQEAVT